MKEKTLSFITEPTGNARIVVDGQTAATIIDGNVIINPEVDEEKFISILLGTMNVFGMIIQEM